MTLANASGVQLFNLFVHRLTLALPGETLANSRPGASCLDPVGFVAWGTLSRLLTRQDMMSASSTAASSCLAPIRLLALR